MSSSPPSSEQREWLLHRLSKDALKKTPNSTFVPYDKIQDLTTLDIIRWVLEGESEIPENERSEIATYAHHHASSLFLILISLMLSLKYLKQAREEGITETLPIGGSDPVKAPWIRESKDRVLWEKDLHKYQWDFYAAAFSGIASHQEFDARVIIPYTYKEQCGEGAFSVVYAVQLEASHQQIYALPNDDNPKLALKSMDKRKTQEEAFRNEQFLLKGMLDTSHLHIIELLATYRQHEKWHFLFPLAECNLQQYMERHQPNHSKKFIKWMLYQIFGLAEGLQLIHENSNKIPLEEAPTLGAGDNVEVKDRSRPIGTGYHHDLKPQNILHFMKLRSEITTPSPELGVFQIADFGVGKFHGHLPNSQDSSRGTQHPRGTPTYAAPESRIPALHSKSASKQGKLHLSRPYDVWSFGCVVTEMLVWLVCGREEWIRFNEKRHGRVQERNDSEFSDAFWIADEDFKNAKVRVEVTDVLEKLENSECAQQSRTLSLMVGFVKTVLEVNPKDRICMADAIKILEMVMTELESDSFAESETCATSTKQLAQKVRIVEEHGENS